MCLLTSVSTHLTRQLPRARPILPHSSGNPRRYLLLAQVLRQQNRTSPCPGSPLGADTRGLRNPAITLTRRLSLLPGTTQLANLGCLS